MGRAGRSQVPPRQLAALSQGCVFLQAMQRALTGFARRQQGSLWAAGLRAYAAAAADVAIAPAEDSPFLRFASPVPHPTVFGPDILSSLPPTDVRFRSAICHYLPSLLHACASPSFSRIASAAPWQYMEGMRLAACHGRLPETTHAKAHRRGGELAIPDP